MIPIDRKTYPWLPSDDRDAAPIMAVILGIRPSGDLVEASEEEARKILNQRARETGSAGAFAGDSEAERGQ